MSKSDETSMSLVPQLASLPGYTPSRRSVGVEALTPVGTRISISPKPVVPLSTLPVVSPPSIVTKRPASPSRLPSIPERLSPERIPSERLSLERIPSERLSPERIPSETIESIPPAMEVSAIPIIIPTPVMPESLPSPSLSLTPLSPPSLSPISGSTPTPVPLTPVLTIPSTPMERMPITPPYAEAENTPLTIEIDGKVVPEEGIEHQLARLGYIVTAKILINGAEHEGVEARFLEAINRRGQKVFIELDTEGFVAISPTDLTLVEGKHATVIPYSVKVGALDCAQMDICGVAFICSNGLCTLQREMVGTGPNIYETNFIYTEKPTIRDGVAKLGDRMTPYPIIRLSEIQENPEAMLKSVDTVTKRIRDTAYASCMADLEKTEDAITNLRKNFTSFKEAQESASKRLMVSVEELNKVYKQYQNNPPKTDRQIADYRLLIANMKKRHELTVDLHYMCQQVSRSYGEISRLAKQYDEALNTLKKEFAGVEYVIKE